MFYVQVAATPEERANGLVGRPTLASDAGVLFVFERPAAQTLDMTRTEIAVDMIFIDSDRMIVGIIPNAKPRSRTKYRVAARSRYALEIRAGLAAQLALRTGQSVDLQAIPGV